MASGNTGKKIHLDVPGRNNNVTSSLKKANLSSACTTGFAIRTQTKRNLFSQINSPNNFVRPMSVVKPVRSKIVKTMATLRVPLSLPRRRVSVLPGRENTHKQQQKKRICNVSIYWFLVKWHQQYFRIKNY